MTLTADSSIAPSTAALPPCSAIVLAGGQALRMGGRDKGLISLGGKPLLAHVLARLTPQVDDIVINCNRHHDEYSAFGHTLAADTEPGLGPLGGIHAALSACRHALVLVCPCDTPFLPTDLYRQLHAALDEQHSLAIAHDGERLQPLFMLLHRSLKRSLADYLAGGDRKVERWCRQENAAIATFDSPLAFGNLNTPEDLDAGETRLVSLNAPTV
ncbi:MAG: molybdenum cofactor guanylyltransferase MobA [Moraxellaceae bacterium]|nr:molybdenum cofactor guanylyltransferase MobA [Moraxellaceae bacterium]